LLRSLLRRFASRAVVGVDDDVPFRLRLAQAVAWCQPRLALPISAASLRSEELRPRTLERDRATIVRSVTSSRSRDAAVRAASPVNHPRELLGGRLLVYYPDLELADGAAEAETGGFFDVNDTPPWDTWVGLVADPQLTGEGPAAEYLISWVPATLVPIVQKGIDVSMVECIAWLENTNTGLASRVQRVGFANL
jgi:hypothetical protein